MQHIKLSQSPFLSISISLSLFLYLIFILIIFPDHILAISHKDIKCIPKYKLHNVLFDILGQGQLTVKGSSTQMLPRFQEPSLG